MPVEADSRRSPPRPTRVVLAVLGLIFVVFVAVGGLWYLSSAARGLWRVLVAVGIGIGIAAFGIGFFQQFAHAPPAEDSPAEVPAEFGLVYVCEVCGLELSVIKVAKEAAPKHCGEEMSLIRRAG